METLEKIKTATAMKEKAEELLNSALEDAYRCTSCYMLGKPETST